MNQDKVTEINPAVNHAVSRAENVFIKTIRDKLLWMSVLALAASIAVSSKIYSQAQIELQNVREELKETKSKFNVQAVYYNNLLAYLKANNKKVPEDE